MGRPARREHHRRRKQRWSAPMPRPNDSRRSLIPLEQESTLIAVVELSRSSWLVAGIVPGLERHPLKKLEPDEEALLRLLHRWRDEAARAGRSVTRVAVAFEAGRDGFWLARWLRARGVEAHVIHPTGVAVSREHRRAKTDRLDTGLLKRAFLGWLRGEPGHCTMAAVPTLEEEDAKRPSREREGLVGERTRHVNRIKVVFTQMTKADVLALGAGGQHVADLDLGVGDDHPVDQQQHELAALLEAGPGQPALHPGPESLERGRHAGELLPAGRVVAQLFLLRGQRLHVPLQVAPPPSVLVERDDRSEVGVREPLQLVPQVRLAPA